MKRLNDKGVSVCIYEPMLREPLYNGIPVEGDLEIYKKKCDSITSNCVSGDLKDVREKVYTRDLFSRD